MQAPEISDQILTEIDTMPEEFHYHKQAIILAETQTGKGNNIIDNWYIPKLKLMQSVTSNIHKNRVAIQWSADVMEQCHVTEVKDPSYGNNQEYESQILIAQINVDSLTLPLLFVRSVLTSSLLLIS